MSRPFVRSLTALAAVATLACSDSLAPEDIVGTWDATSMVFTRVAAPSTSVNFIAMGVDVELVFASGGVVTLTFTEGMDTETDTGTWTLDGESITLTFDGDPATGTVTLDGDTLTVNLATGVEYDFDDDGTDEAATLRIVMTRR
jgi:hypothetical protein